MKKVQKGFTLVELIVVITILAILGTIAFISLQGYSQDARNSKVVSDIRSLASAIEVKSTEGIDLGSLVDTVAANAVTFTDGTTTYAGGIVFSGGIVDAGNINFVALGQSSGDFGVDTYKIGVLKNTNPATKKLDSMYQVVGAYGPAGSYTAEVKGNYLFNTGDETGLVSATDGTTGLTQDESISTDTSVTPNVPNL